MGNSQTALSGIHPFKDDSSPPHQFIPPAQIKNLALPELPPLPQPQTIQTVSSQMSTDTIQPQQLALGWTSISSNPQPEKFDELFVVKAPTPPPRRISYNEQGKLNRRLPKQGILRRGFTSLRTLPRMISRPDLAKIRGFFRKKRVIGEVYPVPPDAEKPSPPSKPEVFHEQDEYFLLRWDPPAYDGGLPIIGYIIQHLELGLPQPDQTVEKDDTQSWFSSEPGQVTSTEVLLNNLIPGTTYQFRVIAENLLGFSQPSDISSPIVFNPNGELDDWFCPPVLVVPLDENYTVIEHERVVLGVEVAGQPYPIVKWYGNEGVELGKTLDPIKYSTVSCGQRRTLTIHSVELSDSGVVRCVGENERGVVETSCVLVVEAPPHIRRVLRSELIKLENPYELTKEEERLVKRQDKDEEELIFQSGELARFKFLYSGSPAPNVCVYHEGDLVDGEEVPGQGKFNRGRVSTEITDNLITVKIAGVKRTDRGEWTVRLDNVLGEDSASVLVTVSDRPSEPGKPDVLQLSDNTVILKWDKPYDDGGCPVTGYVVEYFRSEWGVWLKACTTKNPYTKIRDLIPGSKYTFRVKAENLYGMSEPSGESVELMITDLASTLRSFTGDGEGTLLMKTVVEEEEEAVKVEEEEPGRRKQESEPSRDATSHHQSDPLNLSPHPPRKIQLDSQNRTPSPSRFLQVAFQPHVVVEDEAEEVEEYEDFKEQDRIPAPPSPRRSASPVAPPRTRTIVQQPAFSDQEAVALTRSQEFSGLIEGSFGKDTLDTLGPSRVDMDFMEPPVRPTRRGGSPSGVTHEVAQGTQVQRTIPVLNQVSEPKKLYSRSEIIKSAATNDLSYYLSLSDDNPPVDEENGEEIEEDPELLKVKEALSKDDHLFDDLEDEEEYESDYFDKLAAEYEEDKKRGVVSRQDSGVSARSVEGVSRGESFNEEEEDDRPRSVQSEVIGVKVKRVGEFERAQSEVVRDKPVFEFGGKIVVEEVEGGGVVAPPVEPRRTLSPSPARSFGMGRGQSQSQSGSRTMLHDRFTDYIAMKASSRNKKIGSSLRSLSSSRYSSNENVKDDSGRSSMQHPAEQGEKSEFKEKILVLDKKEKIWRKFDAEVEIEAVKKLERSVSVGGKGLSIFTCVPQQRGGGGEMGMESDEREDRERVNRVLECACVSTPEIYSSEIERGFLVLEYSRSESNVGWSDVPDSGLKERVGAGHVVGGVDYETEEESSCFVDERLSGISEEGESAGRSGEKSGDGGVEREVPRDRVNCRLRKRVSFGSSDVEEISWDAGRRGVVEKDLGGEGDEGDGDQEEREGEEVEEGEEGEGEDVEREGEEGEEHEEEYEEEGYEERDDTHAGDEELEYHHEDEFDDDEVFEMDVEGIDPRVFTEEEAYDGEEDSSSGVMYVLLDPEGLKMRDLSEFEPEFGGRDEKLERLMQKIDQFLGEEEDDRGRGYVEEIDEGECEGEDRGEEEIGDEEGERETGLGEEKVEEEAIEGEGQGEEGKSWEEQEAGIELGSENREGEGEEKVEEQTFEGVEDNAEGESREVGIEIQHSEDEEKVEVTHEQAETRDIQEIELEHEIQVGESNEEKEEAVEEAETREGNHQAEIIHRENLEDEDTQTNLETRENEKFIEQHTDENLDQLQNVQETEETRVPNVSDQKTHDNLQTIEQVVSGESQVLSPTPTLEHDIPDTQTSVLEIKQCPILEKPKTEQHSQPPSVQTPEDPAVEVIEEVMNVRLNLGATKFEVQEIDSLVVTQPKTEDQVPPCDKETSLPSRLQIIPDDSQRIEAPPPPPRPSTFSYKTYMTEKQKTPPHYRSSSRDSSKTSSFGALPTVKEEPSNGSHHHHKHDRKTVQEKPYKPNMSVYFELKSKSNERSLRSSTSSLSSQELPQTRCLVFRSPSEEDDPPVSIEEIRARIEQNRLEMLKPLIDKQPVEEEQVIVKNLKVEVKEQAPISPFMNYLFNAAFYLMLSPMLFFVDSLYFGLLCLLLVACVHFFFIRET